MRFTTSSHHQPNSKLDRLRHSRNSNPALNLYFSTSGSRTAAQARAASFSTLKSILSIVVILIALSFITVSMNGNVGRSGHRSFSKAAGATTTTNNNDGRRVTAFADAAPLEKPVVQQQQSSITEPGVTGGSDNAISKAEEALVKQAISTTSKTTIPVVKQEQPPPARAAPVVSKETIQTTMTTTSTGATSNGAEEGASMLGPQVPLVEGSKVERRSRAKTFMVVFMGHSGSTAFITELRNHPDFEVEKLEPVDHFEYETNTDLALKHARQLLDNGIAKGKIPGFKIRPYHIRENPKAWQDLVKEYDTRIFWQFRVNIMKQAVGEYRHRVLNDTSVVEGLKSSETACDKSSGYKCQFRIDNLAKLHDLLNDFTKNDEVLGEAVRMLKRDDHMLAVKYEDYLYRRHETMKETLDFLGVDQRETEPQRAKASPDSLCHMVTNYQEVCRAFYACQLWRPYLDDDKNGCYCRPSNGGDFQQRFCHRSAWYQKDK